ncbi:MAG: ferrous iron transport protein B [Candidatus Odinarchaeota archaeon]
MLTIALSGNPNAGKSVIFNALTGLNQQVSNFPRTTVERKNGTMELEEIGYAQITDLPGIYSLTAQSLDEIVSRDFIIDQRPELLVNIVDASNLDRHLYLTIQLIELQVPMIVCLNKLDIASSNGLEIDCVKLAEILGVPVIPMIATAGEGINRLRELINNTLKDSREHYIELAKDMTYSPQLESVIQEVMAVLEEQGGEDHRFKEHSRWMAIKYLEDDQDIIQRIEKADINGNLAKIRSAAGIDDPALEFANQRYQKIDNILSRVVSAPITRQESVTELLDDVLTHKWVGIPIFIFMMWMVFEFTFTIGDPFMELIELLFYYFGEFISMMFSSDIVVSVIGVTGSSIVIDFIQGTIVDGVGSVIVFLPNIVILFIAIALLEDSGYMARAAFNMDRVLSSFGLHGQSFIPMALGIGCNIPGIMATRGMRSRADRLITIFITPFMSCSARLPVYVILAGAFFTGYEGTIILFMYLLGILVAIFMAFIFRQTLFRQEASPFLMEFPVYLRPELKSVGLKSWVRAKMFLRKAGHIIFLSVAVIWMMNEIGLIKPIGKIMQIFFFPFNLDWQLAAALLFGFVAKEIVVGGLGTMYGDLSEGNLQTYLAESSPLAGLPGTAFAYMVFVLLYMPCVATIGAVRGETNSWKWTAFVAAYTTSVAYVVALLAMFAFPLFGGLLGA